MADFRKPATAGTAVLALVGLALLASGCGGSPTPAGASHHRNTPLVSIFEAQQQLLADPPGTLDHLRRLGVDVVRVFVPWASLAPRPLSRVAPRRFDAVSPAAYPAANWRPFDAIVRAARARGMTTYFTLEGPAPLWAAGRGAPPRSPGAGGYWKPAPAPYGAFVRAVATRYSGHFRLRGDASPLPRVGMWSLWNEPNDGPQLAPQATHDSTVEAAAALYRRLLDQGWSALRAAGHGSDTILIGELAPLGQSIGHNVPGDYGEMVPLRFVRALYCVDAGLHPLRGSAATLRGCPPTPAASRFVQAHPALFQPAGMAVHPYPGPTRIPPDVVLSTSPDFANLAALPRLERLLDSVFTTYGVTRRLPLYSTEYGYLTDPPYQGGAPPPLAAAYLNWAEYITWRDPVLRSFDQYLLTDPTASSRSNFVTGLQFADRTRKATYYAWRMPLYLPATRARRGARLEIWGCARPAHGAQLATGQAQQARIELRPPRGRFETVKRVALGGPGCYFDTTLAFLSSGSIRLAWSYPHGPTIYSREVPITVTS